MFQTTRNCRCIWRHLRLRKGRIRDGDAYQLARFERIRDDQIFSLAQATISLSSEQCLAELKLRVIITLTSEKCKIACININSSRISDPQFLLTEHDIRMLRLV